jgi:hypothetical protein
VAQEIETGFRLSLLGHAARSRRSPYVGDQVVRAGCSDFDSYDWRHDGLEGNLISFLRACWERKHEQISADLDLERDFRALLTTAVSRGSHAAIAHRDYVFNSATARLKIAPSPLIQCNGCVRIALRRSLW